MSFSDWNNTILKTRSEISKLEPWWSICSYYCITVSTGKPAANVNSITLRSAFNLPIKSGLKSGGYQKPSGETLHKLRNKYQHLKVLIIDEISMVGRKTFEAKI